jgi:two-component system OmpR family sensor kinase
LRTPLTSIQGYLELYDQGHFEHSAQLHDVMRRMTREATRMKDLVEDLLLLANLDQQRPLRHDTVDLNRLITDAAIDARAVQPKRSIFVDTPPAAVEITGDLFRLQQVISALVDNALTHTDPGAQIRLAVRTPSTGPEVVVADSGAGLDAGRAARAFDRFFRGDDSRSRRTGNSGLGLSIARSIIEAHHGTIDLDTAPGQGCTFTIRFPPQDSDRA